MSRGARLIRFGVVGAGVAALYVCLYVALLRAGMAQALANVAAFGIAVACQYVGQAMLTFERRLADGPQVLRFVAMIALGLLTSALVTGWIGPAAGLSHWSAAILVALILPSQNFVLMSLWVFAGRVQRQPSEQTT